MSHNKALQPRLNLIDIHKHGGITMERKLFVAVFAVFAILFSAPPTTVAEQKPRQLELFGVALKGASRDQLRQAFKQNGMRPTREDKKYWVDTYNARNVLDGASDFEAGYVAATDKFAFATYTFPAFMDTQLVGKVINMVSTKYGRPSSLNGDYSLGRVIAKWNVGKGMQIEVSRGWPDTTTFLTFIDASANSQMQTEIDAEKTAQERQKAKSQNKAF